MATRRPPIPRAGRAGQPAGQRGENAAEDTGPVAKVIPLGAAPRGSRSGTGNDAGAPGARPATGRESGRSREGGAPTGAREGKQHDAGAPAGGRRTGGAKPAVPKSPRTKRPASEQRARERAELSGAIRAPQGAADAGPGARSGGASAGTRGGGAPGGRPAGARSGTPSGGGPGGPSAPGGGQPVPARSFSGRLLALAVVLVAITVLLLPSVGTYANQRSEIAELRESIAAKEAEQADLKQQIARWDDPVYIKQQARDRINLVMPGERKYMVIGSVAEDEPVPDNESPGEVRQDLPWVDALWDTTKRAATD